MVCVRAGPLICAALLAAAAVLHRRRLSPMLRVLAAAAVAGLCIYGSGLVHPPGPDRMIRDGARALGSWTYVLVGALAFLETGGGLGLIAPGEIAVILGGVSAGQGELSLPVLIALVWACALAGDLTSYGLGRRLGRDFLIRHGAAIGVSEQRLAQTGRFYADHGGPTIVLGRFIGLVRVLSPFVAGASRMSVRRFAACTTLSSGSGLRPSASSATCSGIRWTTSSRSPARAVSPSSRSSRSSPWWPGQSRSAAVVARARR